MFNSGMAEGFYKLFWNECGTHGLTVEQKVNVLCELRDLSLKHPYFEMKETDKYKGKTLSELFPNLIPSNLCKKHTHLTKLSGLLLYTMHMELFSEIKELAQNKQLTDEQLKQIQNF